MPDCLWTMRVIGLALHMRTALYGTRRSPRQLLMSRLFSRQVLVFWGTVRPCLFRFARTNETESGAVYSVNILTLQTILPFQKFYSWEQNKRDLMLRTFATSEQLSYESHGTSELYLGISFPRIFIGIFCAIDRPCNQHCESRTGVIRSRWMSTQASKQSI